MCNVQHNTLIQDKNMLQVLTLTVNVVKDLTSRQQQLSLIILSLNSSVYTLSHTDNIQRTAPYTLVKRNGFYRLVCVTKAVISGATYKKLQQLMVDLETARFP